MAESLHTTNTALRDRVITRCTYQDNQGRGEELETQSPIPEEVMNKIGQYIGDGKGRLSVGGALSSSVNFGFKAEAMVNATVACDSDPEIMVEVNNIIYPVVEELIVVNHAKMSALRDQMLPESDADKRLNLDVEFDEPAKPATRPQSSKPTVPAKATAPAKASVPAKATKPAVTKPSFRR